MKEVGPHRNMERRGEKGIMNEKWNEIDRARLKESRIFVTFDKGKREKIDNEEAR